MSFQAKFHHAMQQMKALEADMDAWIATDPYTPRRVEGDEITENFSLSGPSRKFAQYLLCLTRSFFREGRRAFGVGVYDCVSSGAAA
jgi:hypothetical protein